MGGKGTFPSRKSFSYDALISSTPMRYARSAARTPKSTLESLLSVPVRDRLPPAGAAWWLVGLLIRQSPTLASKRFSILAERYGQPGMRFQDLRHTHASIQIAANVPVNAMAHRLGHATPNITLAFYGHLQALGRSGRSRARQAARRGIVNLHLNLQISSVGCAVLRVPPYKEHIRQSQTGQDVTARRT